MAITKIADILEIAPSTVHRNLNKLGYPGKIYLKREVKECKLVLFLKLF
jgi:DNA-binding MurR/RpiR family transcriptional regulator